MWSLKPAPLPTGSLLLTLYTQQSGICWLAWQASWLNTTQSTCPKRYPTGYIFQAEPFPPYSIRTQCKNSLCSRVIPLFHSFFSPTQSGQNGSSLQPDSLFLQTSGELIQILGTPRHSRAVPQARPRRIWKKSQSESLSISLSVCTYFVYSREIRAEIQRRPP